MMAINALAGIKVLSLGSMTGSGGTENGPSDFVK